MRYFSNNPRAFLYGFGSFFEKLQERLKVVNKLKQQVY